MADIFISYARDNRDLAQQLAAALETRGWTVWWDQKIPAGRTFREIIAEALDRAGCVVVIWSAVSVTKRWVLDEAEDGLKRRILVPVFAEAIDPPLGFRGIHTANLVDWDGSKEAPTFRQLVEDIGQVLEPAPTTEVNDQVSGDEAPQRADAEDQLKVGADDKEVEGKTPLPPAARPKSTGETTIPSSAPPSPKRIRWKWPLGSLFVLLLLLGVTWFMDLNPFGTRDLSVFRDRLKDGSEGPEMVIIPAGRFTMGSPESEAERGNNEGPALEVTIARAFAIGKHEVTFAEYDRFAVATGRKKPGDNDWGRGNRPIINVSWDDAQSYVKWLSEQTGKDYRLPSEAEWEYAARAGTQTPFWTGECINTDQANYYGDFDYDNCSAKTDLFRGQTVPVDTLPANTFGLHNTAGNVSEWVEDCWHDNYEGAPSDSAARLETDSGGCDLRVIRGGSWLYFPQFARSADRDGGGPGFRFFALGFRLAQDLP